MSLDLSSRGPARPGLARRSLVLALDGHDVFVEAWAGYFTITRAG